MSGGPGLRRRVTPVLCALCLAVPLACASSRVEQLDPPPALQPLETTTTVPSSDYTGVRLAGVSGRTRTTVVLGPGRARLGGTVAGPDGPVAGAVVHVERLVGDVAASTDVTAGTDGRWALAGVLGGRYRVRAWRAPDMALLEPQVFFLEATEARQVGLVVARFGDTASASAVAPDPPIVGQPANLSFGVFRRVVDDRGTVRSAPLANVPALLTGGGQWSVLSPNPLATNASGGRSGASCAWPPGLNR